MSKPRNLDRRESPSNRRLQLRRQEAASLRPVRAPRFLLVLAIAVLVSAECAVTSGGTGGGLGGGWQPGNAAGAPAAQAGEGSHQTIEDILRSRDARKLSRVEAILRTKHPTKSKPQGTNPEIDCSVVKWNAQAPQPGLEVVCPPREVFAPLHMYLQITWAGIERAPKAIARIAAPALSQTKLRTRDREIDARLQVCKESAASNCKPRWIRFDQLSGIFLEGE